jgi:neurotransmitter:Na+ symporter, NSS family
MPIHHPFTQESERMAQPPRTSPQVPREQWGTRTGFVLAAVGSAVGLGNMWRFSYLTAENGGAAFLVLFIVMLALIGLPIMLAEFVMGRGSKSSPIQALTKLGSGKWKPAGAVFVACGFLILSYYAVIAGWTMRYAGDAILTGFQPGAAERFTAYSEGGGALLFHLIFMLVTIGIVSVGVRKGIERTAMFLMPLLFMIVAGIAIYAAFLPGASAGYSFYFQTDFGAILDLDVLRAAVGQAFFSLSLGMGVMITFASYLSREDHLPQEATTIAGADFLVAFVAGLMVFPLIFALGLSDVVGESTIGALFIGMPEAFHAMGATGRIVGLLFFVALFVGALTSAISMLELVVSSAIDTLGWTRAKATIVGGAAIALVGIPSALSSEWLGIVDEIAGTLMVTLGGLIVAVFVGWVMMNPEAEAAKGAKSVRWFPAWRFLLRWIIPPILTVLLVLGIIGTYQNITGMFANDADVPAEVIEVDGEPGAGAGMTEGPMGEPGTPDP